MGVWLLTHGSVSIYFTRTWLPPRCFFCVLLFTDTQACILTHKGVFPLGNYFIILFYSLLDCTTSQGFYSHFTLHTVMFKLYTKGLYVLIDR